MARKAASFLLLALLADPALASPIATGTAPAIPWGRLLLVLAFCLVLAWGAILFIRKYRQGPLFRPLAALRGATGTTAERRIRIIETRRASAHGDLCLVECDGETYLLALTANGVTVLDRKGAACAPRGAA